MLYTFGSRANGRLGDGNTSSTTNVPTQVGSDTDWQDVSINGASNSSGANEFTYAIKSGMVYGTGINLNGQINFTYTDITTFVQIGEGDNYTLISAGDGWGIGIRKNTP
jgi:hypothetical protein